MLLAGILVDVVGSAAVSSIERLDGNQMLNDSHAIAVLTEWDEFITYDWNSIYQNMYKPAFVFDGRNILDASVLNKIGFQFKGIGKG